MTPELEEYILTHIDKEDELLASLDRNTHLYHLRPRMVSGHLQGRILKMFCRMIGRTEYWNWEPSPDIRPCAWPKD